MHIINSKKGENCDQVSHFSHRSAFPIISDEFLIPERIHRKMEILAKQGAFRLPLIVNVRTQ